MDTLPDINECKHVYNSYCDHLHTNLRNTLDLLKVTVSSLIHAFFPQENFCVNSEKLHTVLDRINSETPFLKER